MILCINTLFFGRLVGCQLMEYVGWVFGLDFVFYWDTVDIEYYISFRETHNDSQFSGYIPFMDIIKYWLYSQRCTVYILVAYLFYT